MDAIKVTHADGYGVILVDNGNNTHCQQFFESVHCIKITRSLVTICFYKWNWDRWRKKGTTIHPKYLLSSKALVQWVARAGQIDYPKALWDALVRWQLRPSFLLSSLSSCKKKKRNGNTHLFTRKIFGSALYIHTFQPYADSTRANQDNFMTMTLQVHNSLDYGRKCWKERLMSGFMNNRRSS